MNALDLVKKLYKGTRIESKKTTGIVCSNLDCDCIDCGDDSECTTETYCED